MFEDFFKALKERADNPIAGAFGISFVLFNWRIFSHLFLSDASVDVRLQAIDRLTDGWLILYVWGCPIVFALAYVIGMPWVSLWIEKKRQIGSDELIELKRGQIPRVELSEKLNVEKLTIEDALKLVKRDALPELSNAVTELAMVVNHHIKHAEPLLPSDLIERLQKGNRVLNAAFQKFIGTPLDSNKLDQTTDQQ